jgi:hypothetical protein
MPQESELYAVSGEQFEDSACSLHDCMGAIFDNLKQARGHGRRARGRISAALLPSPRVWRDKPAQIRRFSPVEILLSPG